MVSSYCIVFSGVENPNANALGLKRNTWLRTSLRRTTNGNRYDYYPPYNYHC